jgi:PKHD-type hydroxylase
MFVIPRVLSADDLKRVRDELARGEFVDGKFSAGRYAQEVKKNLQLKREGPDPTPLDLFVLQALSRHEHFRGATLVKRILPPLFSKYAPGMQYGAHVDSAVMGTGQPIRADVAITIFLSDPKSYDGGELIIETPGGEKLVKLPAGDAFAYAATTQHRVAPVTGGERLVAVTWAQSYVRDDAMRQILHDLSIVAHHMADASPQSEDARLLSKSYANLLRKVVEM